jgi:Domain of unknown function (DUF4743)
LRFNARMKPFQRHVAVCNAPPPAPLRPFHLGERPVGFVAPAVLAALADAPGFFASAGRCGVALAAPTPKAGTAALGGLAAHLSGADRIRLRGEAFDVREVPAGPVLATLDRGALPAFGIAAAGVHVNGLVRGAAGTRVWVGIRAANKTVAPGQIDNIVAGGTPAGLDAWTTMIKEAGEEAALPPALAAQAKPVARLTYRMWTPQGLRRDTLECFDLDLPEGFTPRPNDGEVERFELWPIARLFAAVRDTETVKFNVNLVLIDLFLREGLIDPSSTAGQALRAGLTRH